VSSWGGEDWFRLGDLDLGLHLVRTKALHRGASLSQVTALLTAKAGLRTWILPATDDRLRTHIATPAGTFPFQEWFVARRHEDEVDAVIVEGIEDASAAPGVLSALASAEAIVVAPSNPYVSIGPIVAVREIRETLEARGARCVAVSPLVGGKAVRGPADRMLSRMAGGTTPAHVASCYEGLIDALVVDDSDMPAEADVELIATGTLMTDPEVTRRLAETVLEAACA
jgi:LPPG:FO 2-phospho-L-lactate transferase